ncbi:hypothetical protein K435DRAFT_157921 [Dendrothele bispora CBS 962.96]|uniref:Uncharacterized protein n=1 Tax=Dendrothele bispora (strain CBS 962.96) TaxID=1314807 RepID=A0A4S8LXR8_DENBC|nr:hypothetical protein K435DRAFT_157921 [Dendrothele bispora CBS 962.96]
MIVGIDTWRKRGRKERSMGWNSKSENLKSIKIGTCIVVKFGSAREEKEDEDGDIDLPTSLQHSPLKSPFSNTHLSTVGSCIEMTAGTVQAGLRSAMFGLMWVIVPFSLSAFYTYLLATSSRTKMMFPNDILFSSSSSAPSGSINARVSLGSQLHSFPNAKARV